MSILGILDAMRSDRAPAERLVWMCLENHADPRRCWRMTEQAIAAELKLGRNTVTRAIRALATDGILEVERHIRRPTLFRLLRVYSKTNGHGEPSEAELTTHYGDSSGELAPQFGDSTVELTTQNGDSTASESVHPPDLTPQFGDQTPKLTPQNGDSVDSTSKTPPGKEGRGARAARRHPTPLPEAWQPSVAACDLGHSLGLSQADVAMAADRMRDWSIGDGKLKADWDATFRNWLRKDASEPRRRPEHAMSKHEQIRRAGNLGTFLGPMPRDDLPEQSFLRLVAT